MTFFEIIQKYNLGEEEKNIWIMWLIDMKIKKAQRTKTINFLNSGTGFWDLLRCIL